MNLPSEFENIKFIQLKFNQFRIVSQNKFLQQLPIQVFFKIVYIKILQQVLQKPYSSQKIYTMENQKGQLNRLNQFKQMMMDTLSQQEKQNHNLTEKLLESIILIHAINDSLSLRALNQNDQIVWFDSNWAKGKQGIYKLRYQILNKEGKPQILLFRIVDQGGQLNINFCIQGSSDLQTYAVKPEEKETQIKQKHVNHLKKLMPQKEETRQRYQPLLRPVPLMRPIERSPENRPYPLKKPDSLPFDNPFGKQEYVGPNSSIFSNGRNPGLQGTNPLERYDPTDPFDYKGRIQPSDQFQGFDQFGNPINKPRLPQGPFIPGGNPFNRQPPGFGGGGLEGGFGGGFGPKFF